MKFMTPRQYGQLLFKLIFKGRTLLKEAEDQNFNHTVIQNIQAGLYNFIFMELCFLSVAIVLQILEIPLNLIKAVLSVAFGAAGGVKMGVEEGVAVGVAIGIAVGVAGGVAVSLAGGVAMGVALGVALGVVGSIIFGVEGSIILGILVSVAGVLVWGSVSFVVSFFIIWSRWFYLPAFLFALFKTIDPRKLPSHWDENIYVPLPFLTSILLNVSKQDRQAAIEEAIFLIRERSPQRKAAQDALVKIAVEEMVKFRDLINIANLKHEISFLPQEQELLPDFFKRGYEEIMIFAANARVALNEFNLSNRFRILERLAGNMKEFQKKMDFAPRKIGVPFGRIASRWLEIVQREIKQIEADVGRPLPNPFIVGNPIKPESEIFVGRQDIIEQIQHEALREGGASAILFIGNRRTGKTSILLNLKRYLLTSLKPVYVDFQDPAVTSNLNYFCKTMAQSISNSVSIKTDKEASVSNLADLTEYLKKNQSELQLKNEYLLLCFDEYERLTEKIIGGEFKGLPDAFRHWVQHLPRTICLFAGSHALNEIGAIDWTDYFINVRTVRISFLDFDSALQLVTKPIERFDLEYKPNIETAKKLVRRLACQPFLLQAVMSELVNHLNTLHRKTATQADIEIAIERLFDSQRNYFEHIWTKETSEQEKGVLTAIIEQKPIREQHEPAIRSLIRKEVLRREDGELVFCVPVFREWILKNQVSG